MSQIVSPYFDTVLSHKVKLYPEQMDNKILENIKSNLVNELEGRCYKDYGIIHKIYNIDIDETTESNYIDYFDAQGSSIYNVKFTCNVCLPSKGIKIITNIEEIIPTKSLIKTTHGPILVNITQDRINQDNFMFDSNNVLKYRDGKNYYKLDTNLFVVAKIIDLEMIDKDTRILTLGKLERMATNIEIEDFFNNKYKL